MNVGDSSYIRDIFVNHGIFESDKLDNADIAVVNTCVVRQSAENKAYSYIAGLRRWKLQKNGRKVIIAGCMAEKSRNIILTHFPFVDLIIGAKQIEDAMPIISDFIKQSGIKPGSKPQITGSTSEFVPVMRGCENFCSYCIVPYVRGKEISIPPGAIESEIRKKIKNGSDSITLVGQNVNSYRYVDAKSGKRIDFTGLLMTASKIKGLKKLSFMTSHPKDMKKKLILFAAESAIMDKNLHFPLQSGSNRILRLMNRGYTREDFLNIVRYIHKKAPGIKISTDIIVGFPGESRKDFKLTLDAIKKSRFYKIYAFKYSPREGTAAYRFGDDVPLEIKEQRLKIVHELHKNIIKTEKKCR